MTVHQTPWSARSLGLGLGAGGVAWTATEYVSHRWVLHGPFGHGRLARVPLGGLHRAHHGDPADTVLLARLSGHAAMVGVGIVGGSGLSSVLPRPFVWAAAAAWTAGYGTYELSHWGAHHRSPRSNWGLRLRRRHFRHHFGAPKANLGVTMSWWDELLGTESDHHTATVPRRHAPQWMLGPNGEILSDFDSDFVLTGSSALDG